MQDDLLSALNEIEDPELGIGIVDLGLVYRADWTETGINVEFTMTAPSCPFGEVLIERVEEVLQHRFREAASVRARLVWTPPWTVERMTETARQKLGWTARPKACASVSLGIGRMFTLWKH